MHISSSTRPKSKEKKKIGNYGKQLIQTEQKPQWMFKRANHINLESLLLTKLVKVTQAILLDPKKPSLAHVSFFCYLFYSCITWCKKLWKPGDEGFWKIWKRRFFKIFKIPSDRQLILVWNITKFFSKKNSNNYGP